jgi:hypothetical protein
MNADHDKTTATTGVVSSHPVETRHWSQKCRRTSRAGQKPEGGLEKGLANLWSRKKITKSTHAGHGQQTIWETPVQ